MEETIYGEQKSSTMNLQSRALLVDLLQGIFGDEKMHNDLRCQISFDCPVCSHDIKGLDHGDGKGNLEVNYYQHVYKCWSCGETHGTHGHLGKLIDLYGSKSDRKTYELIRPDEFDRSEKKYKVLRLPDQYRKFDEINNVYPPKRKALNYLRDRGVTQEIIDKYDIGFALDGEYAGRVIVPSYNVEGDLNYFVTRSVNPRERIKYKNPEAPKETLIFNESRIDWTKDIWIVEGVFDSFFVDNSIPLLGKFFNDKLWEKVYDEAQANIIICLDPDAWEDAKKIYFKLSGGKLYGRIKIVKLPDGKDLGDLRGEVLDEYFVDLEK